MIPSMATKLNKRYVLGIMPETYYDLVFDRFGKRGDGLVVFQQEDPEDLEDKFEQIKGETFYDWIMWGVPKKMVSRS